jgi:hypothetical protein
LQPAAHHVDDVVGRRATTVVSLVDYGALLVLLRVVVAIEIRVAGPGGVREIDVGESPVRKPIDRPPVVFHPRARSQRILARDRNDGDLTRAIHRRATVDAQHRLTVDRPLEDAVRVRRRPKLDAVDGEQIVALRDANSWSAERCTEVWVPVLSREDALEAIPALAQLEICPDQADWNRVDCRSISPEYEGVAD